MCLSNFHVVFLNLFLNAGKFTTMELSGNLKPNAWPREHLLFILMVVSKIRGNDSELCSQIG